MATIEIPDDAKFLIINEDDNKKVVRDVDSFALAEEYVNEQTMKTGIRYTIAVALATSLRVQKVEMNPYQSPRHLEQKETSAPAVVVENPPLAD